MLKAFLLQLAKVLALPTLKPDKNGACLLVMRENQIELLFEADEQLVPNTILLSCPLLSFPMEKRADIYEEVLKVNRALDQTLSVKPDEDLIYLHQRLNPDMQADELKPVLDHFLNLVTTWRQAFEKVIQSVPKQEKPPPSMENFKYKA